MTNKQEAVAVAVQAYNGDAASSGYTLLPVTSTSHPLNPTYEKLADLLPSDVSPMLISAAPIKLKKSINLKNIKKIVTV